MRLILLFVVAICLYSYYAKAAEYNGDNRDSRSRSSSWYTDPSRYASLQTLRLT